MQAKRVNGTEGVALMERLDPNSPVYAVRWDIKENKGTSGSSAFGVNYMEAMFAHEPSIEEVALVVADWLRSETQPEPLQLDGDLLWYEPEERSSLESYLQGTEGTVKLRTLEGTLRTLDAAVALRVIQEMNAYAVALESYLQGVAEQLDAAEDMEALNAVDLYGGKPSPNKQSELFLQTILASEEANSPTAQATKLASMVVNKVPLTAAEALSLKALFPVWGSARLPMGTKVAAGFRFTYEGTLYEVVLEHALQADWLPGVVPNLYKVVQEEHEGTEADPIPWQHKMELEEGKYYTDKGVLYRCIRSSGQAMDYDLKDLVSGGFVEEVVSSPSSSSVLSDEK